MIALRIFAGVCLLILLLSTLAMLFIAEDQVRCARCGRRCAGRRCGGSIDAPLCERCAP